MPGVHNALLMTPPRPFIGSQKSRTTYGKPKDFDLSTTLAEARSLLPAQLQSTQRNLFLEEFQDEPEPKV